MLAHFVLLVILVAFNIKYLWREIKKIDKKIWLALLLIFLFGFYLRNSEYWLGTHTDGYVAQEAAHLWVTHGQFVKSCALGNHENCQLFENVLAPPGYPFIIALVHLTFGIHSLNASVISAILSSLTIILVFLITYLIFKKEFAGLYAAIIYALIPLNIINSQSGEARPTGLFFVGLAVIFYLLALKNKKIATWLAAIACLSYAIYVRQESYVLVPLFGLFWIVFQWPEIKVFFANIFKTRNIAWQKILSVVFLGAVFLTLQLVVLNWLLLDNPYNSYQGGGFFALNYKGASLQAQALFLQLFNQSPLNPQIWHYGIIVSIIFLITIIVILIKKRKENYFIISLFLVYFVVYSLMVDANIVNGKLTGDYFRRSLMFNLPYAVIAGYGIYLLDIFKKGKHIFLKIAAFVAILIYLGPLSLPPLTDKIGKLPQNAYSNYSFYFPQKMFEDARATKTGDPSLIYPNIDYWQAIAKTPNPCIIITSQYIMVTNDYFPNNQRETLSIDLIFSDTEKIFKEKTAASNCLVYLEDYRCDPAYFGTADFGCQFLEKYFNKKFLFSQETIKVYSLETKENSSL